MAYGLYGQHDDCHQTGTRRNGTTAQDASLREGQASTANFAGPQSVPSTREMQVQKDEHGIPRHMS